MSYINDIQTNLIRSYQIIIWYFKTNNSYLTIPTYLKIVHREEQVFRDFNSPHKPVRVFTYLIGREISDLKAANWMACSNKGKLKYFLPLAKIFYDLDNK